MPPLVLHPAGAPRKIARSLRATARGDALPLFATEPIVQPVGQDSLAPSPPLHYMQGDKKTLANNGCDLNQLLLARMRNFHSSQPGICESRRIFAALPFCIAKGKDCVL